MTDDIVTRLERIAGNYKTSEFEFLHTDYEAVCEAALLIERMRTLAVHVWVDDLQKREIGLGELLEMLVRND